MPTGTPRLYLLSLHAALPIFSTGLVGSQAASAGALAIMGVKAAAAFSICPTSFFPMYLQPLAKSDLSGCHILRANRREFKLQRKCAAYDFGMTRKSFRQEAVATYSRFNLAAFSLHGYEWAHLMHATRKIRRRD